MTQRYTHPKHGSQQSTILSAITLVSYEALLPCLLYRLRDCVQKHTQNDAGWRRRPAAVSASTTAASAHFTRRAWGAKSLVGIPCCCWRWRRGECRRRGRHGRRCAYLAAAPIRARRLLRRRLRGRPGRPPGRAPPASAGRDCAPAALPVRRRRHPRPRRRQPV